MKTCLRYAVALLGLTLCLARVASAQAISGVVTDEKGGVIMGAQVTITSPAMIEGSKTTITNEAGRYIFVDLRPGTYEVTFELKGFTTVKKPGILVTAGFTAPVNAVLKIAAMEQTVVVEAAPPLVDVQSIANTRVQTREELDAIPTKSRDQQSLALTIPGTTLYGFGEVAYHGTNDGLTAVDGIRSTVITVGGVSFSGSFSNEQFQEMSFTTAMESAEMGQPGMMINLIPRDGGNEFRGSLFFNFTTARFNDSNTAGLMKEYGVDLTTGKTLRHVNLNGSFGGPIIKNKLWFHATGEYSKDRTSVVNGFANKSTDLTYYIRDTSRPNVLDPWRGQGSIRLTWQATSKDKITGHFDHQYDYTAHADTGLASMFGFSWVGPDSALIQDVPRQDNLQIKWSRIQTPRLIFDIAFSSFKNHLYFDFQKPYDAWSGRYVEDTSVPKVMRFNKNSYTTFYGDWATGEAWGPYMIADTNVSDTITFSPSLSYVTGSHVLKAGLRYFRGSYFHPQGVVGGVDLIFIAGTPTMAILGGLFPPLTKPKINGDYGWFVQDKWTIKRLTLNLGLRMDHLMSSQQAIDLPATALLPRIRTPKEDILNWKDLSPRIGASLDLFGNAKTSVKFGLARFVVGETQGATNSYSTISKYDTAFIFAPWNDKNGDRTIFNPDGTVQWDPTLPPFAAFMPDNPSELAVFDPNYGKVVESKQIDPELKRGWFKRGYSWEYNIGVQHELTSRLALNFLFYRRWNGNGVLTDDRAIEATSAYYNGPFCISRPADPRLPGGGGGQICGLYDIKPEHVNHVPDNYQTFAKKLLGRDLPNYIQGFDIAVNGRFVKGVFLQGGLTVIKSYRDNTLLTTLDNPEFQYPIRETPYNAQIKFNGQYTLPWQIAVSGSYSMLRGPEISYDWPSAPVGFTLSNGMTTRDVLVSEPSREYYPFVHQANLRFGKVFKVNERYSFKPSVDFYNIFNSDGITAIGSSYAPPGTPGSNWRVPTGIVQPRQFRITAQLQF